MVTNTEHSSLSNDTTVAAPKMDRDAKPDVVDDLIDFDGPDDPYKPLNWPMQKKVIVTVLYSFCTMGTTWASTMSVLPQHNVRYLSLTWPTE